MRLASIFKSILRKSSTVVYLIEERGWGGRVPLGQLWVNWFFKVFFGVNKRVPYSVHFSSKVLQPEKIIYKGRSVSPMVSMAVSGGCYIQAMNGLEIGEGTIWAPNVVIVTGNHDLDRPENAWSPAPPVKIGNGCWIGANAVILPGVTLGDRTVVGAGSVVTHSFPDGNVVIGGVPARVISVRTVA